jgi:hypothetical protein
MRHQSWRSVAVLALVVAAYFAAYARAQAQADAKAASVMADVRKALGGEQKIAAVKGLSLRADYRREMSAGPGGGGGMTVVMMGGGATTTGSQQTTGKIEIDLDLPDKYLRIDTGSAAFGMTRTDGFEASRPFLEVVPNTPGMRIQVDNPASDPARAKAALKRCQIDLARLYLGLTGGTQPGFAVTYAYGGQAESPDGKADIIDVTGPDDFKVRLFVDETHLPLMLTYMEPEARVVMRTMTRDGAAGRSGGPATVVVPAGAPAAAPPAGATHAAGTAPARTAAMAELTPAQREEIEKQMKEAEATPPKLVEYRLFFSDYRKVDGVSLPHHIARGLGAKTTEEWDITSYKVNPSFKADRFKVGS